MYTYLVTTLTINASNNNHIRHASSQHNHLDILLISIVIHPFIWSHHNITVQKVRAHTRISGNKLTGQLAIEGTALGTPTPTSHIHVHHTILA